MLWTLKQSRNWCFFLTNEYDNYGHPSCLKSKRCYRCCVYHRKKKSGRKTAAPSTEIHFYFLASQVGSDAWECLCNTNIPVCEAKDSRCLALCLDYKLWADSGSVSLSGIYREARARHIWMPSCAFKTLTSGMHCVTTQMCNTKPAHLQQGWPVLI